jgi:hypothetical protein
MVATALRRMTDPYLIPQRISAVPLSLHTLRNIPLIRVLYISSQHSTAVESIITLRVNSFDHTLSADWLVGVVGLAVREEVVDDHADDGEEEDDESPDDLVRDGAVRLEDLDPSNDVKDQDNETNDAATGACLPGLRRLNRHGRCLDEEEHGKLKES